LKKNEEINEHTLREELGFQYPWVSSLEGKWISSSEEICGFGV
jgi:hypothetical protein